MERNDRKINRKYGKSPLLGAALALSLTLNLATGACAYAVGAYADGEREKYERICGRCAYDAYCGMCESIRAGDSQSAAEALSRCELFSGAGETPALRAAIMADDGGERLEFMTPIADDGDTRAAVRDALLSAEEKARSRGFDAASARGYADGSGWETLKRAIPSEMSECRRVARESIGGGVTLEAAENNGFPPVYTFFCTNAAADVTRAGARLLRMYVHRRGCAEIRDGETCRASALEFAADHGLGGAVIVSETAADDAITYSMRGTVTAFGERIVCDGECIKITVQRAGAFVSEFDATEYYRCRPLEYSLPKRIKSREYAAEALGEDGGALELAYSDGRLFWRKSGAKTPELDAENGEIRVQNP